MGLVQFGENVDEELHLPVVRGDLVLDEAVDERADPLLAQPLGSKLQVQFLILVNLDVPGL